MFSEEELKRVQQQGVSVRGFVVPDANTHQIAAYNPRRVYLRFLGDANFVVRVGNVASTSLWSYDQKVANETALVEISLHEHGAAVHQVFYVDNSSGVTIWITEVIQGEE